MSQLDFIELDKYLLNQNGRIIHQIWFGTIPNKGEAKKTYSKLKIYRDSWLIKNPTWCRIEWNKTACFELIQKFYPEHNEMFKQYKYEIQRCDTIRYVILHRYGGWYVDMDYYCNRPLDDAMKEYVNDIYLVQSPNGTFLHDDDHVSNSLMYSTPRHNFWKQVLLELEKNQKAPIFYTKHLTVMLTTGPGILNRIYSKYKYRYKVKSLPWKLFHPYGIQDAMRSITSDPNIFALHISQGSWAGKDTEIINFFVRDWPILVFIICVYSVLFVYFLVSPQRRISS